MSKVSITIDGYSVVAKENETILQAALRHNIYIPHLCYHPELKPIGVCRLCFVNADSVPVLSCMTRVEHNMNIQTSSPEVDELRRINMEVILANHHVTCRGCTAIGHCTLQTLMGHIRPNKKRILRLRPPEKELPLDTTNPFFDYDPNKCVLCKICVQTCDAIQKALYIVGRGYSTHIAFYGDKTQCASCAQCVMRCPVGALIPKDQLLSKQASSQIS